MGRGFQVRAASITIVAHLLFIAITTLLLVWLLHFREGVAFFSSSNPTKIFNLHPLLMVIGFILVGGEAIRIYKSAAKKSRSVKVVHLLLHLVAMVAGVLGITAVFKSKKEVGLPDMYTLHSWLGMSAICLFGLQGCDASVLLASTQGNPAERDHFANNPSLRGFEVIEDAKAQLEAACPQTVSCADILALAARDSALKVGGINYDVPTGRRDGLVSVADEAAENLPAPTLSADELVSRFSRKGLSADEMVTLSGAHSIGVSHCSSFSKRLYSFNETLPQDPSMDSSYAETLKTKCPAPPSISDPTVSFDPSTPIRLDTKYYDGLINHRGLLTSDQTLFTSQSTREMVLSNANDPANWSQKFAKAMVQMGSIDVLTGSNGEIRKHCTFVN